jgi:hypothetical protein
MLAVCGHYDCGGVRAALKSQDLGTMENWVRNVRDVVRLHQVCGCVCICVCECVCVRVCVCGVCVFVDT